MKEFVILSVFASQFVFAQGITVIPEQVKWEFLKSVIFSHSSALSSQQYCNSAAIAMERSSTVKIIFKAYCESMLKYAECTFAEFCYELHSSFVLLNAKN